MQERGESPPTQACRKISGWRCTYTQSRHTQVETNEAERRRVENIRHREERSERKGEREGEKEMGWDVRLFATRTEQFPAELLISSSEGKKNKKSKMLRQ